MLEPYEGKLSRTVLRGGSGSDAADLLARIFGQEASKELLIEFLNDLLEGERVIRDVTFLNNEQLPAVKEERTIIYDVYCRTDTGEEIIVEMQNRAQPHFKERALYYLSNAVVNQGKTGGSWDYHIKAVYGVFFLNFDLPGCEKLRTNVILADSDTGELFSDKLKQIYISLPRFNKTEAECETNFERWIYVLNNMETLERLPFAAYLAVVDKLEKIASIRSLTKDEELQYFHALNTYRTNKSAWDYGIETATKEGHEKGLAEGMEKGIKKGRTEGMKASAEKIARNLKAIGTATDVIMKVTGLSADEISKL